MVQPPYYHLPVQGVVGHNIDMHITCSLRSEGARISTSSDFIHNDPPGGFVATSPPPSLHVPSRVSSLTVFSPPILP